MDARTRERLPVLPVLVRTVDDGAAAQALLDAARQARPGEAFTAGRADAYPVVHGRRRVGRIWADDPGTGSDATSPARGTARSGHGRSSRSCGRPACRIEELRRSAITAWSSTGCRPPANWSRCSDRPVEDRRGEAPASCRRAGRRPLRDHLPGPRAPGRAASRATTGTRPGPPPCWRVRRRPRSSSADTGPGPASPAPSKNTGLVASGTDGGRRCVTPPTTSGGFFLLSCRVAIRDG